MKDLAYCTFGLWFPVVFFGALALISNLGGGQ